MANNKSTEKRIRQGEKRRVKNSAAKASLRTVYKKVNKSISASSEPKEIIENFNEFVKKIDTAAGKGTIHKKNAARKKSRIAKRINASVKI
ncbi:MAG: 30S ribosomal protein S20 [Spirochaetes bacterium]|nr:30S ribosomal protein S20 [Spirochaetota bacterium]